ncbi:phasin family protein [Polymorphobacter fuscus]|uniref:Phasin domain-containing protein n=1 Tax=Sandarakinorhabdus fusca TaxID=1439888 RepID=A0A7C9GVJ4_9SPHN|nr:phasin family protein [Polymorphobacter fuscus]KAB7646351.1 hypothetical protein F9290_09920 [Polymorphobacter fuscus]MQT17578.1 hypothetical protein [Polymorphobacter fuscus]NJC09879.1 phasin family protein [Polymorphobacter fuscus]
MTGSKNVTIKRPRPGRAAKTVASEGAASVAERATAVADTAVTVDAAAPAEDQAVPAAPRPLPVLKSVPISPLPNPSYEEPVMATAFENTSETVKSTVNQFNESAESAMSNGKAAMEQVAAQAKDAAEASMKSIEEMTDVARGNVEALLASARAAAAGFETLAQHISEVSRKSFESTTTAARAMTSAKTPNELFQLQSDFAKTQFDVAVSEFSKMTEMMVKLSGEVMEPVQNRVAITTDKMKTAFTK